MTGPKLCGRITDHPGHHWPGIDVDNFDLEGHARRVEFWCPGRVVVEGGSPRNQRPKGA